MMNTAGEGGAPPGWASGRAPHPSSNPYQVPLQAQAPMGLLANICSAPTPLNFVSACLWPVGCKSVALDPSMPKTRSAGVASLQCIDDEGGAQGTS